MGLDITCYEKVEPFEGEPTENQLEDGDLIYWCTLEGYESRLDGIKADYLLSSGEEFEFRAGSYGGYNQWRNLLALAINGQSARWHWENAESEHLPFGELINFADNEGCIGPKTSAKLAKDFESYGEKFAAHLEVDDYDRERYLYWSRGFRLAADTGCVEFH